MNPFLSNLLEDTVFAWHGPFIIDQSLIARVFGVTNLAFVCCPLMLIFDKWCLQKFLVLLHYSLWDFIRYMALTFYHTLFRLSTLNHNIMKAYLYNFDPLKPHFYIVKLGFIGVYIIFLISAQKHRLWVLIRTASSRRFWRLPTIYVSSRNMKNIRFFYLKIFNFWW